MRRALFALLCVALLLAAAGAADAQGRGRGRGGEARGGVAPLGDFQLEPASQTVSGVHVSFNFTDDGIQDFRAGELELYDLRVVGDEDEAEDEEDEDERDGGQGRGRGRGGAARADAEGAQLRVRADNFTFTAHDNPTAVGKLQTDGRVVVTFGPGVVLSARDDETVSFAFGNVTGALRGDDLVVAGRVVEAAEDVLIVLNQPRGSFDRDREVIGQAVARGHVGAEVTLQALDEDDHEQEVVSYGNVTVTTVKAERGNITMLIEGHGFEGRVLVFNVDGRVLGAESADKLDILLDNVSVRHASNLTDILDPDDDGYHPEHYLVYDPAAQTFQLIVTVPHYSVHTLSVTTLLEVVKPSVVVGILAGVALLVPTAGVLFRRK